MCNLLKPLAYAAIRRHSQIYCTSTSAPENSPNRHLSDRCE